MPPSLSPDHLRGGSGRRSGGLRRNRHLQLTSDGNGGMHGAFARIPTGIGIEEGNVELGLGSATGAAAGSTTLSQTVPRPVILRDLIIAAGPVRGRVTSFQAAGVTMLLGSTSPVEAHSPLCQNRPSIDLPVYTGSVSVGLTLDAPYTVDASIAID